jgi:hypothetical protein
MFMTFLTSNHKLRTGKTRSYSDQAGISLLLAILILSAITAVAFSLATIVFIEVRSSGDVIRTEPALYATMGVTEEALFQYKRFIDYTNVSNGFDVPSCQPTSAAVCNLNGVVMTLPGSQPLAFDDSPRVQVVQPGETVVLPLYYPATNFNQIYSSIRFEILPTSVDGLDINFNETDINGNTTAEFKKPITLQAGDAAYTFNNFSDGLQYDLVLTNTSSSQDISVSIASTKLDGTTPSGLPFLGEQVLRIKANYQDLLTRTYEVRIPIP